MNPVVGIAIHDFDSHFNRQSTGTAVCPVELFNNDDKL